MKYLDPFFAPFAYAAGSILNPLRRIGLGRLPITRWALLKAGVIPVRDHYYEPKINHDGYDPNWERDLPGINLNVKGQVEFLKTLTYANELDLPADGKGTDHFHFGKANNQYRQGDAEILYQIIRATKPKRIVEIGSGWSTKIAVTARDQNLFHAASAGEDYHCRHVCIEPYEDRGLEAMGIELVRKRVEDVSLSLFSGLEAGDILFIDSTHMIRPGGDVLWIYLNILPRLKAGVIVHVHDIFTPYDYPKKWVTEDLRFWNEQYLLEAMLSGGKFDVLLANYFMSQNHFHKMKKAAPYMTPMSKPGSFWMRVK
jgi:hypothetical protein